jgi:hypothetical protein
MLVEGKNKGMKPEETVESGIGRELVTYCFMTEKYCFGDKILESDLFFPASFYLCIFYGVSCVRLCFYFVLIPICLIVSS